jgi:hypothetical protein
VKDRLGRSARICGLGAAKIGGAVAKMIGAEGVLRFRFQWRSKN